MLYSGVFTAVLIHFITASVIVILVRNYYIISLCSIVMSLCHIIIIILSAYNVTNKAEQCPNKPILIIILVFTFCYLIVMFLKYLLIVTCDAITYHVI